MMNHFNVLVTRPKQQAASLKQLIESAGGQTILLPTLEIQPEDETTYQPIIASMRDGDIAIFLSANAIPSISLPWKDRDIQVIAIGPSTQQALIKRGIAV